MMRDTLMEISCENPGCAKVLDREREAPAAAAEAEAVAAAYPDARSELAQRKQAYRAIALVHHSAKRCCRTMRKRSSFVYQLTRRRPCCSRMGHGQPPQQVRDSHDAAAHRGRPRGACLSGTANARKKGRRTHTPHTGEKIFSRANGNDKGQGHTKKKEQ